jgi:hypothetical protein
MGPVTAAPDANGRSPERRRRTRTLLAVTVLVTASAVLAVAAFGPGRGVGQPGPSSTPGSTPPLVAARSSQSPRPAPTASPGPVAKTPRPSPSLAVVTPRPQETVALAALAIVNDPRFSGHVEVTGEYRIETAAGNITGQADFSGEDFRSHLRVRWPSIDRTQEISVVYVEGKIFTRQQGHWVRVYTPPGTFAGNLFQDLRPGQTFGKATRGTGPDRDLWAIEWPAEEQIIQRVPALPANASWSAEKANVTVFVTAEGLPVRVDGYVRGVIVSDGRSATMEVTVHWAYSEVGSDIVIQAPSETEGSA